MATDRGTSLQEKFRLLRVIFPATYENRKGNTIALSIKLFQDT